MRFHDNLNREQWLIQWFGSMGRELATRGQDRPFGRRYTDNPLDIITFVDNMRVKGLPAWMSVQMFKKYGTPIALEKTFFDFDDPNAECPECGKTYETKRKLKKGKCPKCNIKPVSKPHPELVEDEVKRFIKTLPFKPFITKTFKGYHVYGFLGKPILFPTRSKMIMKEAYKNLMSSIISKGNWRFLDRSLIKDIMRVARIPTSYHEKGVQIIVLDEDFNETEIRGLDYYRSQPIPNHMVKDAISKALKPKKKKEKSIYQNYKPTNGKFSIRPCFLDKMELGHMPHQQRLAFLLECYHSGYKTEDQLVEMCKCFSDFSNESRNQAKWFLDNRVFEKPPYRCKTIEKFGWCLKNKSCYIWKRKNNK